MPHRRRRFRRIGKAAGLGRTDVLKTDQPWSSKQLSNRVEGATMMESTPRKPRRVAYPFRCALLGLACLLNSSEARPIQSPSEQFPGPWLEVTQEVRDILAVKKVSACSQAAGRESSRNPGEYLLYCTSDEKLWTSWRVQPAARTVRGPGRLFQDIALPNGY
jgi:hypothetical protein